ncbi:ATP-binding cassette domain-containing protein [Candidatus Methanoperedens nitratireducens]|uniref:Daunorubicin resistance ABC transporter ATP-binding subunit n=1 Tax=Candidatus Methanoperedens nitratireducens TaxID=1392998 RepID=A0A284VIV4_9EURY|nr:ATP-binding cassette domain-containing protein [Candidatus Methanoperedens nitroreducens]SNQ59119.1 Daunorubicin resistance ABC transporter ATP-binding subunit [Candidatus Methanoperedens nitroreducens]
MDAINQPESPNRDKIIQIKSLDKTFQNRRTITAVKDVSFDVINGEIFGLLGPNGAGKTTLIRMLTTLIKPTSGTAIIAGYDIKKEQEQIRNLIGVCPQNSTIDNQLTAWENLDFYAKLFNMPDDEREEGIRQALKIASLVDRANTPVYTFSGGMRRKLEIARAFIHKPLILFLDEPTIALDPESRRAVWQQIITLNSEGVTIILTTHYMDEAEKLCNRVAFINGGKLVALDSPDNLKKSLPTGDLIDVVVDRTEAPLISELKNIENIIEVKINENKLQVSVKNGKSALPQIVNIIERYKIKIESISMRSPSLEDVFIHYTGKKLDAPANDPRSAWRGTR